jgi:hypothetical protein
MTEEATMFATKAYAWPLRTGTTVEHEFLVQASDASLALHTVHAVLDVRRTPSSAARLSLRSGQPPTAGGSALAIVTATPQLLLVRLTLGAGDTATLPGPGKWRSDLLLVWPDGPLARPARVTWTPDGSFTAVR